jgi:hypothetical protein
MQILRIKSKHDNKNVYKIQVSNIYSPKNANNNEKDPNEISID